MSLAQPPDMSSKAGPSDIEKLLPPEGAERLEYLRDALIDAIRSAVNVATRAVNDQLHSARLAAQPVIDDVQAALAPLGASAAPVTDWIDATAPAGWPWMLSLLALGLCFSCFLFRDWLFARDSPYTPQSRPRRGVEKQLLIDVGIPRSDAASQRVSASARGAARTRDVEEGQGEFAPLATARGSGSSSKSTFLRASANNRTAPLGLPARRNGSPSSRRTGAALTSAREGKTPRNSARGSGKALSMHQEAAPPVSARSGWFSARVGYSACEEADGIQSVRTRSRFDPCHSTPQTEGLASADHRIQLALGLEAAGGVGAADELDPTVLASPTARNFHYISLPPPPPLLPRVDELFFILHSTRVPRIPEPLPDAFKSWVRNALPFGDYYGNSKLRTRDIYGFDNEGSIFDEADFVVHLPVELNPSLVRTVNFVQKLFKPGSKRMPGKSQIIMLPIRTLELEAEANGSL